MLRGTKEPVIWRQPPAMPMSGEICEKMERIIGVSLQAFITDLLARIALLPGYVMG
jgi:hypothetical protein